MSPRSDGPKYEWRVQYRRRWWQSLQCRIYQSAPPARRLIARLLRRRLDLEPLVDLLVQRRVVGEWEDVEVAELIDVDHRREPAWNVDAGGLVLDDRGAR